MSDDKTIPPIGPAVPVEPKKPLDPARHVAPAAHSEAAAHAAQDAGMEAAAQQAAITEEVGRDAMARIEGGDPVLHPHAISPVMPDAPQRRRKRVRRVRLRKKK